MKSSAPSRPSESSAQPPAIETRGLTRTFGSFTAVDSLDLTVRTGIVYGLLGPNGAGKSTTLRMITTLLAPTRGTARVLGHDVVAERHAVRSLIGVTGQYASVDEMLTGVENLRLFGRLLGLSRRQARERADELLASFSLTQAGGTRPTTGLDPRTREQMWDVIRSLVDGGSTILLTTQYLEEADRLAHQIGIIDHGRLVAEGTPDELKDRVGSSALILTPATPGDQAATATIIERVTGHAPAVVDQGTHLQAPLSEASVATEVLVALRDAGLPPRTVSVDRPSMDAVFMALTGKPQGHSRREDPARATARKATSAPGPDAAATAPASSISPVASHRPSARPSQNQEQS